MASKTSRENSRTEDEIIRLQGIILSVCDGIKQRLLWADDGIDKDHISDAVEEIEDTVSDSTELLQKLKEG